MNWPEKIVNTSLPPMLVAIKDVLNQLGSSEDEAMARTARALSRSMPPDTPADGISRKPSIPRVEVSIPEVDAERFCVPFFIDLERYVKKQFVDAPTVGVYFVDPARRITFWNDGASRITGHRRASAMGHCCREAELLNHVGDDGQVLCDLACPLETSIRNGICCDERVYFLHHSGSRHPAHVWTAPQYDERERVVGALHVFTDSSEKWRTPRQEYADQLTGLGNHDYLQFHIENRLADLTRYGHSFGVLLADVDYLEQGVNAPYGHDVGNEVIRIVGQSLASALRRSDLIARNTGGAFVIVLPAENDKSVEASCEALHETAERLRHLVIASRFPSLPTQSKVTISLGGALRLDSRQGDSVDLLLSQARSALRKAKTAGGNRVHVSYRV